MRKTPVLAVLKLLSIVIIPLFNKKINIKNDIYQKVYFVMKIKKSDTTSESDLFFN